jgi:hypothetical protein
MHEFESTLQTQAPPSHTIVVYDSRDGRIVYTHEFIGEGDLFGAGGQSERERISLEAVRRHGHHTGRLRVLHLPTDFRFEIDKLYSVDPAAGTLTVRADVSARALQAQRSAR